jgi:hypothetical protein
MTEHFDFIDHQLKFLLQLELCSFSLFYSKRKAPNMWSKTVCCLALGQGFVIHN